MYPASHGIIHEEYRNQKVLHDAQSQWAAADNRETGENPARTRHCKWVVKAISPLSNREGGRGVRSISQETCLLGHILYRREIGVWLATSNWRV